MRWSALLVAGLFVLAGCGDDTPTAPSTGTVEVTASTTGDDVDSDGYTVTLDGDASESLGANGSATFTGVSTGEATLELTGVAANCSVSGDNPRTVQVQGGQTASTTFDVACTARTGDLEVSASTTGEDQDSDGYTVTVDPGTADETSQALGVNGTVTFADLPEGDHEVELSGVAGSCSVGGDNPRTVSVPFDGTASTTFDVSCSDVAGSLEVSASTGGTDLDQDGYTVTVDPGTADETSQALGVNGTVTFSGLTSADHEVELSGIRGNCSVITDPNPRTVTVPAAGTASTTFEVDCAARTGSIEVTTATTGSPQDPDGYTATVDPGTPDENPFAIGVSETIYVTGLDEGNHEVELSGLADNCWVNGDTTATVSVAFADTVPANFNVECFAALSNRVLFESDRDGDLDIYVMDASGAGLTQLTNEPGLDRTPAVSPDGLTIAFASTRGGGNADIWLMNADGSNPRQLTSSANPDLNPSWAPNGEFIVFERGGDIHYVEVATGAETQLTSGADTDGDPAWDRGDGNQIAFVSDRGSGTDADVYVMQSDGSGITPVTTDTDTSEDLGPSWNPGSCGSGTCTELAFFADRSAPGDIYKIDWDGSTASNETQLTTDGASDYEPSWSSSGSEIVFVSERDADGNPEIFIMNPDGSGITQLTFTASGLSNEKPHFSP